MVNKNKKSRIAVLYHKNCFDGFSAAWAAWKKFGDKAEYIPIEPEELPDKPLRGKEIYIVDNGYNANILEKLAEKNKNVIVLDHHISRKKDTEKFPQNIFDNSHSGAVLAWKYFHPKKSVPKLLFYVEDNDLWKFRLPFAREISVALDLYNGFDFKKWSKVAADFENKEKFKKYVEEGKLISKYRDIIIKRIMSGAEKVKFEKQKAFVVNSPFWQSEIGNFIVENKKALGIIWSRKSGKINISLRSNGKIDVSRLAVKYGGGGHKAASGFSLNLDESLPWIKS